MGIIIDTATGVLHVHVLSARGIKGAKLGGGTPDPYIGLSIENRGQLARTKFQSSSYVFFFPSSLLSLPSRTHYFILTHASLSLP